MNSAAAAVTNDSPAHSQLTHRSGITVNAAISVAGIAPWKREAIKKVLKFNALPENWDGNGSRAAQMGARQTAIQLLLQVPLDELDVPRVVPVSGGGYHFEWSVGDKELEISVDQDCSIEALRVNQGVPLEEEAARDLASLFGWLLS